MKTLFGKLLFWLTVHRSCGWCSKRLHRAWFPRKEMNTSHGICPACFMRAMAQMKEARR